MPDVRVSGVVRLAPGAAFGERSVLRISLLDVTAADRAATVVTEQRIAVSELESSGGIVAFDLAGAVDPLRRYVVSAHADLDGDGTVSTGDQVSTQSYPVATFGYPNRVEVELQRC
jgi:hypothetical protein